MLSLDDTSHWHPCMLAAAGGDDGRTERIIGGVVGAAAGLVLLALIVTTMLIMFYKHRLDAKYHAKAASNAHSSPPTEPSNMTGPGQNMLTPPDAALVSVIPHQPLMLNHVGPNGVQLVPWQSQPMVHLQQAASSPAPTTVSSGETRGSPWMLQPSRSAATGQVHALQPAGSVGSEASRTATTHTASTQHTGSSAVQKSEGPSGGPFAGLAVDPNAAFCMEEHNQPAEVVDAGALYAAYMNLAHNIVLADEVNERPTSGALSTHSRLLSANPSAANHIPVREDVDLRMKYDEIMFASDANGGLIGAGAVGSVYKATWKVG